jgi:outer membrane protein with beta-barrel domain
MSMRTISFVSAALVLLAVTAAPAAADGSFGLGPRFSFVRATADTDTSTRYSGGMLRIRSSPRTALEVSLDYRSVLNDSLRQRIRDYPIQGSLLLYLTRSTIAPYLVGGFGWYTQRVQQLDDAGLPVGPAQKTRRTGGHTGLGADFRVGGHASLHLDYRYTFVHYGDEDVPTDPGGIPIPGTRKIQEKLNLSHEGSMWTTGVTVYF